MQERMHLIDFLKASFLLWWVMNGALCCFLAISTLDIHEHGPQPVEPSLIKMCRDYLSKKI